MCVCVQQPHFKRNHIRFYFLGQKEHTDSARLDAPFLFVPNPLPHSCVSLSLLLCLFPFICTHTHAHRRQLIGFAVLISTLRRDDRQPQPHIKLSLCPLGYYSIAGDGDGGGGGAGTVCSLPLQANVHERTHAHSHKEHKINQI